VRRTTAAMVLLVLTSAVTAVAQRRGGFGGGYGGRNRQEAIRPNTPYDGRFTFARVRYGPDYGFASQRLPWSHDYPTGEQHFMKILNELSYLNPYTEETNILALDDPQLFKYPVAYLCEPGFWTMTDQEAVSFRTYLQKGGFVIFDDFTERRGGWATFETQMLRVLPTARFVDLDASHPIFHSFFEINDLGIIPQFYDLEYKPVFRGIFQDNDPTKRLMVIVNFNTDISEFWEWSDTGLKPIDESNEAYKLGVNYIIYGMTH